MTPELEARVLACKTLPSLPVAALEVLAAGREPHADLQRMGDVLQEDPVLAARIIRAANAAAFGWGEVTSVRRAVNLLGANRVLCVTLTFSLVSVRRLGAYGGFDHGAYWRRSLHAALAARALAERGRLDADEAFLAALVQDLGMLALAELLGDGYGALVATAHGRHARIAALEQETLGATHADVSLLLLGRWGFPSRLLGAIRETHAPAAPAATLRFGDCVHLSGAIADVYGGVLSPGDAVILALDACRAQSGLDLDAFAAVLSRVAALVPEVEADLEVTLAAEGARRELLAAAKAALEAVRQRPGAWLPVEAEPPPAEPDDR